MRNNHEAHNDRADTGPNTPLRDAAVEKPMADREVPLAGLATNDDPAMLAIHQWLDGDLSEADARRADAKQVQMWTRVASETDRRKRMVTPAHVAANIMNAIPEKVAAVAPSQALTSTVAPGFSMPTVVAVGTALFAIGILVGKMFL